MIDPVSAALHGLATGDAWTPAFAFSAGAFASFSPCVAPRMLAVAALCANKPSNSVVRIVLIFTCGVVAAYSVLTISGALLWRMVTYSGYLYVGLAIAMAAAGVVALVRHAACQAGHPPQTKLSASAIFLLGASSAATFSPCCMPVVAAAVLYSRSSGPAFAWLTVTCFALGHATPLILAGAGSRVIGFIMSGSIQAATRVVAGALMLALAGLYCVLA